MTGYDHTAAKNRSYDVRSKMADAIGATQSRDFTVGRYVRTIECVVEDHRGTRFLHLVSTSNAGFRGIEGLFEDAEGAWQHASLGSVTEWQVIR